MAYHVSIAEVSPEYGIGDALNFTCGDTFATRDLISQLCNGWQMKQSRVVFVNGKFAAFGNPTDIRAAIADVGIHVFRAEFDNVKEA